MLIVPPPASIKGLVGSVDKVCKEVKKKVSVDGVNYGHIISLV